MLRSWHCSDCGNDTVCPKKYEYFEKKGRMIQCLLCDFCGTNLQSNIKTDDDV